MQNLVSRFIEQNKLFIHNDLLIVGVSGGVDSTALLHVLLELGYRCEAAHCHFHLRGEESDRDAQFVEKWAKSLNIPFHRTDFDTRAYAREQKLSVEMAARELRYQWFETLRQERNAQAIVVAHHADDVIETMLMNLVRGTGIDGLRGIAPRNGRVVRPLLSVSRQEILAYLQKNNLRFVEDSSNSDEEILRNKFRHSVIPLLESINPSFRQSALHSIAHWQDVSEVFHQYAKLEKPSIVEETPTGVRFSISELKQRAGYASLLHEYLKPLNFNSAQTEKIAQSLELESGKQFFSPTHRLVKDRDFLLAERLKNREDESYWIENEQESIDVPLSLRFEHIVRTEEFTIPTDRNTACLDADKLRFPLQLRRWRQGDTFCPLGMTQHKKLSDYFIDRKFSLPEKEAVWLLLSDENIVWIVGERMDNRYKTDENTRNIYQITK